MSTIDHTRIQPQGSAAPSALDGVSSGITGRALPSLPHAFLLMVAVYSSAGYLRAFLATDEGLYFEEALRILRGEVIYRDFFDFVTPGVFLFIAGIFRVFGAEIVYVRVALFLIYGAQVCLTYALARRIIKSPVVALLPPLLFIEIAKCRSWWVIDHHVISHLFALFMAYLLVRYVESSRLSLLFAAGVAAGLAVCTTQHLGALLVVVGGFWVLVWIPVWHRRLSLRSAASFLGGALLPVVVLIGYLAAKGALTDAYSCTVQWIFSTYRTYHSVPYYGYGLRELAASAARLPSVSAARDVIYLAAVGYLPLIAFAAASLLFIVRAILNWHARRVHTEMTIQGIVLTVGIAIFVQVMAGPNAYFIRQTSTLAFVFVVWFLEACRAVKSRRPWVEFVRTPPDTVGVPRGISLQIHFRRPKEDACPRRPIMRIEIERTSQDPLTDYLGVRVCIALSDARWRIRKACAVASACLLAIMFMDVTERLIGVHDNLASARSQRNYIETPLGRLWSTDPVFADDILAVQRYVDQSTARTEKIFAFYWSPYLYCVTGRPNALRYSGTLPGYHDSAQNSEMVTAIRDHVPTLIIEDRILDQFASWGDTRVLGYGLENLPREPIGAAVRESYQPVVTLRNFTIHVPKRAQFSGSSNESLSDHSGT